MSQLRNVAIATLAILLFAGGAVVPAAAAQVDLLARTVGSFAVSAAGQATGENLGATIDGATGVLSDFTIDGSAEGDVSVFNSVAISGFTPVSAIQGVGSASLFLEGSNSLITATDTGSSHLTIEATASCTVSFGTESGVYANFIWARGDAAYQSLALTSDEGVALGWMFLLSASSSTDASSEFILDGYQSGRGYSEVSANLEAGEQIVFKSIPAHLQADASGSGEASAETQADAQAYLEALQSLAAHGWLTTDISSEYDANTHSQAIVDLYSDLRGSSTLAASNAFSTALSASASARKSLVVNHDLDYETLAIQSPSDIAVYVGGTLAARASSAAQIEQYASQGLPAYWGFTSHGRAHVLASVQSDSQPHTMEAPSYPSLSVVNVGSWGGSAKAPKAEAQAVAKTSTDVVGHFQLTGDLVPSGGGQAAAEGQAKFLGRFSTGVLQAGSGGAEIRKFTSLTTRTEVYDRIAVTGEVVSEVDARADWLLEVEGPTTRAHIQDEIASTLILDYRPSAPPTPSAPSVKKEVAIDLSKKVTAEIVAPNVARIEGPSGYVGWVVITRIEGGASTGSTLKASALSEVSARANAHAAQSLAATLEPGARMIVWSSHSASADASQEVIAKGVASGQIAGSVALGLKGEVISHVETPHYEGVALRTVKAVRGEVQVKFTSSIETAQSFVLDSRGTAALAAKSAKDVSVSVNGQKAVLVSSASAALATDVPTWWLQSSAQGSLQVLVNTAGLAASKGGASVKLVSNLALSAQANSKADLFGTFKVLPDGTAIGSFVSAKIEATTGTVSDFTITAPGGQTKVFESIRAGASGYTSGGVSGSPKLVLPNRESRLEITDQTSAITRISADTKTTAIFELASSIQATKASDGVVTLSGPNGFIGALIVTQVEGSVDAASKLTLPSPNVAVASLAPNEQVIFKAFVGVETELDAAQRTAIAEAISNGNVVGQVVVQSSASAEARAAGASSYGSQAALDATTSFYEELQMVTAATQGQVTVTIASALHAGKTLIISVDPATMPSLSSGEASILIDGEAAAQASSYADILNPANDGGVAEYFVLTSEASGYSQVLVSVPHFSVRTVTLTDASHGGPSPVFMWLSAALAAIVVAESVAIVRMKKNGS